MLIAILICCIIIILLLIILFIKLSGGSDTAALEKEIALLREGSDRQARHIMAGINGQGESLRADMERQSSRIDTVFEKLRAETVDFREDTNASLNKINRIVSEKLRDILDSEFESVVKNMSELGKSLSSSQDSQRKANAESIRALENKFTEIRNDILNALKDIRAENTQSLEQLRNENKASLDSINDTVNQKLQKTLDDRISKSFETVNKRLAEVYQGLGEMKNVASGVSDLKNVLSNVKNRGILGEIQLSAILDDILARDQYEEQFKIDPEGRELVDFAVKLPGQEDGQPVYLPIDAKFPGDTYAALADAYDSGDAELLKERRAALMQEIKRCAKSISEKYIKPPYSTDFAIMFLPFEGLYAEVVNMGLVEVLQRDHKVNITGPSTMAAMLNSLQMGFRTLAIQKKSGEVWTILAAAKTEFAKFEKGLNDTRNRLRQADEELEKLVGTRTNAINRRLRGVSGLDTDENAAEILEIN